MIFSELITDLQNELKKDLAQIRFLIKKNPGLGYNRIVTIGKEVGKKYNIKSSRDNISLSVQAYHKIINMLNKQIV